MRWSIVWGHWVRVCHVCDALCICPSRLWCLMYLSVTSVIPCPWYLSVTSVIPRDGTVSVSSLKYWHWTRWHRLHWRTDPLTVTSLKSLMHCQWVHWIHRLTDTDFTGSTDTLTLTTLNIPSIGNTVEARFLLSLLLILPKKSSKIQQYRLFEDLVYPLRPKCSVLNLVVSVTGR